MELRWTERAVYDLERIADYLFKNAPDHAERIVRAIYNAPSALVMFPYRGRPGKKAGTRELLLSSLPYIIVYKVKGEAIHIVRIVHTSQKWP